MSDMMTMSTGAIKTNQTHKDIPTSIANLFNEVNAMTNATQTYSSKEVAQRLSIQPVTVRKYAQLLEDKGFSFPKDEKGWRQYSEEHIQSLEYLCTMKSLGKSLDESAERIATLYRMNLSIAQPAIPLQEENIFMEFIKSQYDFNQKLAEQLNKIEQRQMEQQQIDRDRNLMQTIRESQEQRAATEPKKWWLQLVKIHYPHS